MTRYSKQVRQDPTAASEAVSSPAEARLGAILKRARGHRGLKLREVEALTGVPNPHLSQIERGLIKKPDAVLLWKLCELYSLDYGLVAQWTGYVEAGRTFDASTMNVALNVFQRLGHRDQLDALRYLESLEHPR